MRYFITLAFCFPLVSLQAQACPVLASHRTLFFEAMPNPQPDADLIAKISLSNVNETMNTATVTIVQVFQASDARVHQGDKIAMKYRATSCGPHHRNGEEGTIIARTGRDSEDRLVLYPYTRSRYGRDGHSNPPPLSE